MSVYLVCVEGIIGSTIAAGSSNLDSARTLAEAAVVREPDAYHSIVIREVMLDVERSQSEIVEVVRKGTY